MAAATSDRATARAPRCSPDRAGQDDDRARAARRRVCRGRGDPGRRRPRRQRRPPDRLRAPAKSSRPSPGTAESDQEQEPGTGRGSGSSRKAIGRTADDRLVRPDVGQGCPETEIGIGQGIVEPADRRGQDQDRVDRGRSGETNAEIRKVWMWGNVALHQDPQAKGKTEGAGRLRRGPLPGQPRHGQGNHLRLPARPDRKDATCRARCRPPGSRTRISRSPPRAYPDEPGDRPGLGLRARNTHATGRPGLPDRQGSSAADR